MLSLIHQLAAQGKLVVAAVGNLGRNVDPSAGLSACPAGSMGSDGIAVTSVGPLDDAPGWADYGATNVDIAAPGGPLLVDDSGGGWTQEMGSSMAAALVSGAAADLWSAHPAATAAQIRQAILQGSRKLPSLTGRCTSGGMVDLAGADVLLAALVPPPTAVPAPVTPVAVVASLRSTATSAKATHVKLNPRRKMRHHTRTISSHS